MTYRQRHRQNLLRTIELWMRRYGAYFVFALCFSLATAYAATDETAKAPAKPSSLMKVLSDKDLLVASAPVAPKAATPAVKSEVKKTAVDEKKKEEKKGKVVEKTLTGRIANVRSNMIALDFNSSPTDEEEYLIPLSKDTRFIKAQSAKDLRPGDMVKAVFAQRYKVGTENDKQPFIEETFAREITVIKSAKNTERLIA